MELKTTRTREGSVFGDGGRDIRNWAVRARAIDRDEGDIGRVDDVLVDESGIPRYLDVALAGSDRHVLVPAGHATADASRKTVRIPAMSRERFATLPTYTGDVATLNAAYDRRIAREYDTAYEPNSFYARPDYRVAWIGPAQDEGTGGELARIDSLEDIDVANPDKDPTGWKVEGADGRVLGTVDHLIGDTRALMVRYLTLNVDRSISDEDRNVLVPVGHVELDTDNQRVHVGALDTQRIEAMPAYTGERIDREYETRLGRAYDEAYPEDRRYEHPRYHGRHLIGEERYHG